MRIPLPRILWFGIEPPRQETGVDGGVHGPVQSGSFGGPVQTVHVVVPPRITEIPDPPERVPDQILDIWKFQARESIERKERQGQLDERLDEMLIQVQTLGAQAYRAVVVSVVAIMLAVVSLGLLFFIATSLFRRFGWL